MGTSLNNNLDALFSKLENFVNTKTVIGDPIQFGEVIIVPLVDISLGVGACASLKGAEKGSGESGGSGLGAKITPSAVIVIVNNTVQLVNVKSQDSLNKLIDMVPGVLSKLNFNFGKKNDTPAAEGEPEEAAE